MPQGRRGRGFNSASYFAFAFSPNSTRGIRDRIASYLTFFLVLAFLAVTGVPAAQIPLAKGLGRTVMASREGAPCASVALNHVHEGAIPS
jgi:hypothetical protein